MPINSFLGVFAKSPLKPLEDHINVVHTCSQGLLPFFEAVYAQDWKAAQEHQKTISMLEKEADEIKRELRISLPVGIFMPIQRQDAPFFPVLPFFFFFFFFLLLFRSFHPTRLFLLNRACH